MRETSHYFIQIFLNCLFNLLVQFHSRSIRINYVQNVKLLMTSLIYILLSFILLTSTTNYLSFPSHKNAYSTHTLRTTWVTQFKLVYISDHTSRLFDLINIGYIYLSPLKSNHNDWQICVKKITSFRVIHICVVLMNMIVDVISKYQID